MCRSCGKCWPACRSPRPRRAPGPGGGHHPLAPAGSTNQCRPLVLPRPRPPCPRPQRPVLGPVRARLTPLVHRRSGIAPGPVVPDPGRPAAGAGRRRRRDHCGPGPPGSQGPHGRGPLEGGRPRHPDRLGRRRRRRPPAAAATTLRAWPTGSPTSPPGSSPRTKQDQAAHQDQHSCPPRLSPTPTFVLIHRVGQHPRSPHPPGTLMTSINETRPPAMRERQYPSHIRTPNGPSSNRCCPSLPASWPRAGARRSIPAVTWSRRGGHR